MKRIGDYRVIHKIGDGGYGYVYKVEDKAGKNFAIKIVLRKDNKDQKEAIAHEHRVLNLIKSDHVVKAIASGTTDKKRDYLVLEYLPGLDIQEYQSMNKMSIGLSDKCVLGVAKALVDIEAAGFVHRDIKPENIFLTHNKIKVIDFGLCYDPKVNPFSNDPDDMFGTPHYMAPEYIEAEDEDEEPVVLTIKYDIYSLGICYYSFIEGDVPFDGKDEKILKAHIKKKIPKLKRSIPKRQENLLFSMLEKKPANRPSPQEVIKILEETVEEEKSEKVEAG